MKKNEGSILLGLLIVGTTLYLMSEPECDSGCETILEHLLKHELRFFF